MTWLDKTLSAVGLQRAQRAQPPAPAVPAPTARPAATPLSAMSVEDLAALFHSLDREREALQERRREITRVIEEKCRG